MNFRKISENYYEFKIDEEVLSISISKFLFHNISFELKRVTDSGKSVNLMKAFNIIKEIIFDYLKIRTEVHEAILVFYPNEKIDKVRWINLCEFYVKRNSMKVSRIGDHILSFQIK